MSIFNKLMLVLMFVFAVITPLLVVTALNTLFPALTIPVTFDTYFATAFLLSVFTNFYSAQISVD